ncbi:hypothetical protein I4U23_016783 [Adineta vaga]|nr:hypothetical protein I4U23_016783 [Adineta vaga]
MTSNMYNKAMSYIIPTNLSEEEITYVEALHLSAREVMNRLSTINEPDLRKQLAQKVLPLLKTPTASNNKQILDIDINTKETICYASCSLQFVDGKFDMYLAYYYSTGVISTAFQALHQRIQSIWSNKLEKHGDREITDTCTTKVISDNNSHVGDDNDVRNASATKVTSDNNSHVGDDNDVRNASATKVTSDNNSHVGDDNEVKNASVTKMSSDNGLSTDNVVDGSLKQSASTMKP